MHFIKYKLLALYFILVVAAPVIFSQNNPAIQGKWDIIAEKSSEIDLYKILTLEIDVKTSQIILIQKWGGRRCFADTISVKTDGTINEIKITNRVFPTNVFMGLSMPVGQIRKMKARWIQVGSILQIEEKFQVRGSQGHSPAMATHTYTFQEDKDLLTYQIDRSTRKTGPTILYTFKRAGTKNAYFMKLQDHWKVVEKLDQQALLISLQGIANLNGPKLYFIYPENWPFNYTTSVFDFYKSKRNYSFKQLKTIEQALQTFKKEIKGYILWDKTVRTSLIVAFTLAGLEEAVVISEDQLPLVHKLGLQQIEDFRGKFTGQNDAQIYTWAYEQYWSRCNKELIIWLGGDSGSRMKPGVADWGIYKKAFFNDLSTKETDLEEYALAKKLLSEMKPMSLVMGWHSYAKDKERDHVKLTSNFGHTVEGLHTLPNMSFNHQIPFSKGFKIKNNHHLIPGKNYTPKEKVYLTCVQTDGLGIGAWLKPGRGEIPYAWEVIMNYVWLAPGMLEYFYTLATPNDYFIGCLSGPGYMYPKAVPPKYLPKLIARAAKLMKQLDLNIFEIMDYSEGATVEGNTELTREVVEAYYQNMPDAIGFLNGYAPAFTFTIKEKRPLISYDYYLSPTRPQADAVADLQELATINARRPYFLLVHVRESSDVKRVIGILDKLGSEFEVVPLDIFLKMAGQKPTYRERFLER